MKNVYFNAPKQVMFALLEVDGNLEWYAGIAYKDEVICSCCGSVFEIKELVENAEAFGLKEAIYPYEDWISFADAITDDYSVLPNGLDMTDNLNIVEEG